MAATGKTGNLSLVLSSLVLLVLLMITPLTWSQMQKRPNIVVLFADDLGYGDLPTYGHPTSSAPHLERLAQEGMVFTQFYSSSPVCSPSRAALLTGRYQVRSGVWPGVFWADSTGGLPLNETTIAEVLKTQGYDTAIIGKWHLGVGVNQTYLPTNHGFDYYYGVPYSHDMCPCPVCFWPKVPCGLNDNCGSQWTGCPVYENDRIVEQPADLLTLSSRYVKQASRFIQTSADRGNPFFLYLAFQHTHHPQFAGVEFTNTSARGKFGDALLELDWAVGEVLSTLQQAMVQDNTLVFFTSDNGPSLRNEQRGGNAGLLKCGKGTTYEGGQRVPAIARWPGVISAHSRTTQLASTLDLFPTLAKLAGATLPSGVILDGVDMMPILQNKQGSRDLFFYYPTSPDPQYGLYAVRYKQYKAHYYTQGQVNSNPNNHDPDCRPSAQRTRHDPPLLFNLNNDPSEQFNLGNMSQYQQLLKTIDTKKVEFEKTVVWGESEIAKHSSPDAEPCYNRGCQPFPGCCHTPQWWWP
ncbi:arylsulfatase A-like [Branchiostoma floridae x Branchiostoma belcheri]